MKDSIININFTNAVKQAERIDQVISRLEKVSISLGASMDTLGTVWKGKSSDDYRQQGGAVQEALQKDIQYLKQISSGIKKTAGIYRKSEMQKLESSRKS